MSEGVKPHDFQRERELSDMVAQMGTETGRRFVHRLLTLAGVFRQTFAMDSHITAFNEGQRSQGLAVLADVMAACPQQYLQMIQEAKALEAMDAQRIANETKQGETE
jgi:hypothetical protein